MIENVRKEGAKVQKRDSRVTKGASMKKKCQRRDERRRILVSKNGSGGGESLSLIGGVASVGRLIVLRIRCRGHGRLGLMISVGKGS